MAAEQTVSQLPLSRKSFINRSGVLMLSGFGIKVRMQSGHLEIEDGVGMERRKFRLARVGHGLKRLVCISEDGFTTLSALKWLADVGVPFSVLNRNGKVLFVTGPTAPSDARLRRAQCLALGNGVGVEICRRLIDAKLHGQERLVRERLNDPVAASEITAFRDKLNTADTAEAIRWLEAHAALAYFGALRNVPVLWPKADLPRIPDQWCTVGSRQSPLSGGPRLAVTPFHAILNYCFALLEAESRLALVALGLDPALGLGLHTDTPNRDSLALDVLEPVRPDVESWLVSWIMREPFRKADFFETSSGNCRLRSHLCAKLSETAPTWGRAVAPIAEWVAQTLWNTTSKLKRERAPATRLTERHRSEAKGGVYTSATTPVPIPQRICRTCGVPLKHGRSHCAACAGPESSTRMLEIARLGRIATHSPKAEALRAATRRRHAAALKAWHPAEHPRWLTEDVYLKQIQPALRDSTISAIASALGVSLPYATDIRAGRRRPHPRHWESLAQLVGVSR
jgi:CRISPR-associated endonuclease Cas1